MRKDENMVSYHVPKPFLDFDNLKMPKEVKIYDRTLRGIVQTTGKYIPGELKADLTKKLSFLGVDVIEVGIFLSDEEYEGFKAASSSDIKTKLSALARTNKEDIKKDMRLVLIEYIHLWRLLNFT